MTDDQLSFWAKRGFLLLKDFIDAETLRGLGERPGAAGGAEAKVHLMDCIRQLADPVGALIGDELELVRIESSARGAAIGRDAWRAGATVAAGGVIATIILSPSNVSAREVVFYPQSHLIPASASHDGAADADMKRVAEDIRSRGLVLHRLSCRPGDVWLRHPLLVCGALATDRAAGRGAPDLEAMFCRREDLPTDSVRQGLAGVLGDGMVMATPKPVEGDFGLLDQAGAFAGDTHPSLRQTTTDGRAA